MYQNEKGHLRNMGDQVEGKMDGEKNKHFLFVSSFEKEAEPMSYPVGAPRPPSRSAADDAPPERYHHHQHFFSVLSSSLSDRWVFLVKDDNIVSVPFQPTSPTLLIYYVCLILFLLFMWTKEIDDDVVISPPPTIDARSISFFYCPGYEKEVPIFHSTAFIVAQWIRGIGEMGHAFRSITWIKIL